jgi:hypothetical protein
MAAVIGSIKEDLGVMGSRCEWPGEEREELVGDSTRFEGCEASLAASLARLGEKNGERESERVPKQRMTMKLLGVWDAGKGGARKLSEAARQSSQPVRMEARQGRAIGRSLADPQWKRFCTKALSGDRRWAVVIGCPVPNA